MPKYRKYNNIHTICNLKHKHPSKGEARKCEELHLRLLIPELNLIAIEYETSYDLIANGYKVCTHRPDWTMIYSDRVEVEEFKGLPTSSWKLKQKLFIACYPAIKYVVTYQSKRHIPKRIIKLKKVA